jgi:hypothetical protein
VKASSNSLEVSLGVFMEADGVYIISKSLAVSLGVVIEADGVYIISKSLAVSLVTCAGKVYQHTLSVNLESVVLTRDLSGLVMVGMSLSTLWG